MNVLLLASHAVAEYDDIRMFTDLGYDVFCPGGYQDPTLGTEGIRPGIPNAPIHADLIEACEKVRAEMGDPGPNIDWAKAHIPDAVLDWADVIICHHFPYQWLYLQFNRIRHKRVIWRTCGQSDVQTEAVMAALRPRLQIVRYSPKEQTYFESQDSFAGVDALIRFGKYPADYEPWTGELEVVGNVTQHMKQRGDACGYDFWEAATDGLPVAPAGPGSEEMRDGVGRLDYCAMLRYLRSIRVYLYTGTRPASYTLGLIEAMMTGTPVVAMGHSLFDPEGLYEGDELLGWDGDPRDSVSRSFAQIAENTKTLLADTLADRGGRNAYHSADMLERARIFDVAVVGPQWQEFLS